MTLSHAPKLDRTVFAHRGLCSRAPENTMPSFIAAADAGVQWLETDVDLLADGTAILIHDSALDRTTNRSGSFYPLVEADLATIDAGAWYGPQFVGTPLPTLDQFIDFLNERGLNANIELKQNEQGADRALLLVDTVIAALDRLDPTLQVIVSSFSHLQLLRFHERAPEYAIGALYETRAFYPDWKTVLELTGASYIHVEDKQLTPTWIEAFRKEGYGVNVWTVNSRGRANELFNWGATGVFTDVADLLLA